MELADEDWSALSSWYIFRCSTDGNGFFCPPTATWLILRGNPSFATGLLVATDFLRVTDKFLTLVVNDVSLDVVRVSSGDGDDFNNCARGGIAVSDARDCGIGARSVSTAGGEGLGFTNVGI